MSLNKFMVIGRCGNNPDVRNLEGGGKAVRISIACTERYKDRSGEQKENTEWFSVAVFGKTAEFCEKYIEKGSQVFVEGRLRNRKYTDKEGIERTVTEVVAESVQLLGSRQEKPEAPAEKPTPAPSRSREPEVVVDEDDLPFSRRPGHRR